MKRIGRPCGFPVSTTWRCTPPPPATLWVFIMILVSADTAADRLATPSRAAINCYWINQEPTCIKSSYTRVGRRTGLPSYIGGRFWEVMWRGGAVRRLRVTNWRRISGEIRRLTLADGKDSGLCRIRHKLESLPPSMVMNPLSWIVRTSWPRSLKTTFPQP
jgi:hypothetical protein